MFYTKYRPQKFSEISRPNEAAESLMKQVKGGKVSHAYLFVGSRGTGKTTTARILAKALNCKKPLANGDPCDKCENCLAIKSGNFVDLIEIDAASNRGIDDIRELKDKIRLAPTMGKRKVYIVDEVHMLTNEAFNALLKTLEEPPSHVNFILCTTEAHKVPDTIKSRCQVFKFKRATVSQLVDKLSNIAKEEGAKVSKEDLKKIAQASMGGFRDAETLLQQVVEGSVEVDSLLNLSSAETYADFVDLLKEGNPGEAINKINKIYEDGMDLYIWTGELIRYLRDLLFIAASADQGLIDTTDDLFERAKEQAESISPQQLVQYLNSITKAQNEIKSSFITQLPLELAIAEICLEDFRDVKKSEPPKNIPPVPAKKSQASVNMKTDDKQVKEDFIEKTENKETTLKNEDDDDEEDPEDNDDSTDREAIVELSTVEEIWPKVMEEVKKENSSVQALLKSSKPVAVEGNYIVLEVFYAFHKERLESSKNRKIVEPVLKDLLGADLLIKCRVAEGKPKKSSDKEVGELTDLNIVPATSDNALDLFDGTLPLG